MKGLPYIKNILQPAEMCFLNSKIFCFYLNVTWVSSQLAECSGQHAQPGFETRTSSTSWSIGGAVAPEGLCATGCTIAASQQSWWSGQSARLVLAAQLRARAGAAHCCQRLIHRAVQMGKKFLSVMPGAKLNRNL